MQRIALLYDASPYFFAACSQQYPLVEERLQAVGGQVAPTDTAIGSLESLLQHIEADEVGVCWRTLFAFVRLACAWLLGTRPRAVHR